MAAAAGMLAVPEMLPDYGSYPGPAMREGQSAAALIEIVVNPKGKQESCKILTVAGIDELSKEICKLQRRAKFKPALSDTGEASYGVVRAFIKYVLVGSEQGSEIRRLDAPGITFEVVGTVIVSGAPLPRATMVQQATGQIQIVAMPDITFQVQALPGVESDHVDLRVTVAIDPSGVVTDCAPFIPNEGNDVSSNYASAACQQLDGMHMPEPLVINEEPVNHIKSLEVRFAISDKT